MRNLNQLSLLGVTGLQDDDLACLASTRLAWLRLSGPSFSDRALEQAGKIKTLSGIEFEKMKLSGAAIARLGKFDNQDPGS